VLFYLLSGPTLAVQQHTCISLVPLHIVLPLLLPALLFAPTVYIMFCRAGLSAAAEPASRGPLAQVLAVAVKAVALLGLLAVSFGPFYSYTLLRIVYSQRWSETEAPFVLGCYTACLLLLAVNGEAGGAVKSNGSCGVNNSPTGTWLVAVVNEGSSLHSSGRVGAMLLLSCYTAYLLLLAVNGDAGVGRVQWQVWGIR
jgi:oligosaccharide translocation protein RFT1